MKTAFPSREYQWKIPLMALVLLLVVGVAAAGMLWQIYRLHHQLIRKEAAVSVLKNGREITSVLASQLLGTNAGEPFDDWTQFSELIHAVSVAEGQLQYVSVTRDKMNVFYEHVQALSTGEKNARDDLVAPELVVPRGRWMKVGNNEVPVISFSIPFTDAAGSACLLEAGWRRQAVEVEERAASHAIVLLFRITGTTLLVTFATSVLVVVWMVLREHRYDRQRRAEEHLAYAGMLASGIVHDFRNPMSSLQLDVQMLRKEVGKEEACNLTRVGQLSERIVHITGRMEKIFQEFLFISRPGAATRESVVINRLLQECLSMLEPRVQASGVQVELSMPEQEIIVLIFTESVRRALMNVLINAEQHAGKEGTVFVRLLQEKKQAILVVANTGDGIGRAQRKKIFELFYTTRPGGTGLGLFLARAAMQRNDGRLLLVEEPGYASCFRIELPVSNK